MATTTTINSNPLEEPVSKPEAYAYMPLVAITFISVLAAHVMRDAYDTRFMPIFMSFWLIQFALVKLFDVQGFVGMFSQYDIISSRFPGYGYVYPFLELALGLAYLGNYFPFQTSIVLLAVASLGLLGVILQKRKGAVYCACMGTITRVPLGRVTVIENLLMIAMVAAHLAHHTNYWNNVLPG